MHRIRREAWIHHNRSSVPFGAGVVAVSIVVLRWLVLRWFVLRDRRSGPGG
jgi:hypothetical protein